MTFPAASVGDEEIGNVQVYVKRGRPLRWYADHDLLRTYKTGLRRWSNDPLDFELLSAADAEYKLRAMPIPFDEECHQLVASAIAQLPKQLRPNKPECAADAPGP